jgi:hypothetical protein
MTENKGYTHPEALVDAEWVQHISRIPPCG